MASVRCNEGRAIKALGLACAVLTAAGCSVINSFDEVLQEPVESGSGGAGAGGEGGGSGGESAGGAGAGGEGSGGAPAAGGADAGAAGGSPSAGGAADPGDGGDAEASVPFNPNEPQGVIVAYRQGPKDLAVVNVRTGTVVSTEPIGAVGGIVNDGATNIWYIFEQGSTPAADGTLHARRLDPVTGEWREVGTLTGRIPVPTSALGVLNERLVYASDAGSGTFAFTMLDTSNPAAPRLVTTGARAPVPSGQVLAFLGSPRSATLIGGSINVVLRSSTCTTIAQGDSGTVESCNVEAHSFTVTATDISVGSGSPRIVGQVGAGAQVGATQDLSTPRAEVVAFPTLANTASLPATCGADDAARTYRGSVQKFSPTDFTELGSPIDFGIESDRITGAAFDSCSNVAFLGTLARDPGIHVVPLDPGGTPYHLCVGGGTGFLFESYERVLFRRVSTGDLQAFRLGGTRTAPTLTAAPAAIPASFAGTLLAVRAPARCQ